MLSAVGGWGGGVGGRCSVPCRMFSTLRDIVGTMRVILSSLGVILSTMGDILSTMGGYIEYHGGYHQYCGGCSVPHIFHVQYLEEIPGYICGVCQGPSTLIMISFMVLNILHSTPPLSTALNTLFGLTLCLEHGTLIIVFLSQLRRQYGNEHRTYSKW